MGASLCSCSPCAATVSGFWCLWLCTVVHRLKGQNKGQKGYGKTGRGNTSPPLGMHARTVEGHARPPDRRGAPRAANARITDPFASSQWPVIPVGAALRAFSLALSGMSMTIILVAEYPKHVITLHRRRPLRLVPSAFTTKGRDIQTRLNHCEFLCISLDRGWFSPRIVFRWAQSGEAPLLEPRGAALPSAPAGGLA